MTIVDPGGQNSSYYSTITANIQAAGARWGQFLQPAADITISTEVTITSAVPRSSGRSSTSSYVNTVNGINVYEQGAGAYIRTGTNPNTAGTPNVLIQLNPDYMQNTLWWDPNPTLRTAAVPTDRNDSMSVVLHELGHAIGFNGWRNHTNGSLPGDYMSTFDRNVSFDGQNLYFNGPAATAAYGGPVPVTYGNNFHIGNAAPRPGEDLIPDLMNGVVFYYGQRYDVSLLDRAILLDSGLPVITPVPEPGAVVLFAAVVGVSLRRLRRRERRDCPAAAA